MRYDEIDLPRALPLAAAAKAVDDAAAVQGLRVTSQGTLPEYPGSIYWRLKHGREPGMLEVILLNRERRLKFTVGDNRQGPWTEAGLEAMVEAIRAAVAPNQTDAAATTSDSGR